MARWRSLAIAQSMALQSDGSFSSSTHTPLGPRRPGDKVGGVD